MIRYHLSALFDDFWKEHPFLLIGIHTLIFTALALQFNLTFLFPILLLYFPLIFHLYFPLLKKLLFSLFIGMMIFVYAFLSKPAATPQNLLNTKGVAYFHIDHIKEQKSPFHSKILYSGMIHRFIPDATTTSLKINHPSQVTLPPTQKIQANADYLLYGQFCTNIEGSVFFKGEKIHWVQVPKTFSLAQLRHTLKTTIGKYIQRKMVHKDSSTLIQALITGQLSDYALPFAFKKCGLQHILAISGFHFALLTFFIGLILRIFLPQKPTLILLFLFITLYALFLGHSASIFRAYVAISVVLIGKFFYLKSSGLNVLGFALFFETLLFPSQITHLGYQLTFLCTFAILLLSPTMKKVLILYFPKRTVPEVLSMNPLNQWGSILSAFLRNALALNLSVHLLSVPVLLYYFHQFPCMSFLYNLFYPSTVALTLFLFILGLILPPLHYLNSYFTHFWLEVISNPPALLDLRITAPSFPLFLLILPLSLLIFTSITLHQQHIDSA